VWLCELVEDGADYFAGPAPCCVEVDYEERVGLKLVELRERFDFLHLGRVMLLMGEVG